MSEIQDPFENMSPERPMERFNLNEPLQPTPKWDSIRVELQTHPLHKKNSKFTFKEAQENFNSLNPGQVNKDGSWEKGYLLGQRQMVTLGNNAEAVGLVDQVSEYVKNMYDTYGEGMLSEFGDSQRYEQFEQLARHSNKQYGRSGSMHDGRENGLASYLLKSEVQRIKDEKEGKKHTDGSWYPEGGMFTYYEDVSEPGFLSQVPTLEDTKKVSPFLPDTTPVQVDIDDGQFTDPWLNSQYNLLSKATVAAPLIAAYSKLGDNLEQIDPREADLFQQFLENRLREIDRSHASSTPSHTGAIDGKAIGDELAKALYGDRLTKDEKLGELLSLEQWNDGELPPINPESPPNYYVDMTTRERDELKYRTILARVAHFKRNTGPPGLETLNKYPEWGKFGKEQTQALYEVPGVRKAMESYVQMFLSDGQIPGVNFSIRNAKDRNSQLLLYRQHIRSQIQGDVVAGWKQRYEALTPPEQAKYRSRGFDRLALGDKDPQLGKVLEIKCREAEQIAFNMLYSGNFFEAHDSQWNKDGTRGRRPVTSSDLLNPVLMEQMKPLDSLIGSFTKDPNSATYVGKFGEWAHRQTIDGNGGRKLDNVDSVMIIGDNKGGQFWTRSGSILLVPEAYPRQMVGSFWDETTVRQKEGGRDVEYTLTDLMKKGAPIPWDKLESQGLWQSYSSKMGKAAKLWEGFQGKLSLKSDTRSMDEWKTEIDGALGKFGKRDESSMKRWLIYASAGVDLDSRKPRLAIRSMRLRILSVLGPKKLDYLPWDQLLFPWDK